MKRRDRNLLREIKELPARLALSFGAVVVLTSEVFAIIKVSGSSMNSTLEEGEKLYLNKLAYKLSPPKVGDVIVFLKGQTQDGALDRLSNVLGDIKMKIEKDYRRNRYIKRVIALPGDQVNIRDGAVYVNNILLEEAYTKGITLGKALEYPLIVPEEKLFVLGDNRENSNDSRIFGFVDYKSVEGKVEYKIWPMTKVGD